MKRTLTLSIILGLAACTPNPATTPVDGFERSAMLTNFADNIIVPNIANFRDDVQTLSADAQNGELTNIRASWKGAMSAWQKVEVLQVGPAGAAGLVIEGASLRDEIYSWPKTNPCAVDQAIVSEAYNDADFFESALVDAYGLDAIEYLAFYEGSDNACSATATINRNGSWQALDDETLRSRRVAYIRVIAERLVSESENLLAQWSGTFGQSFREGSGEFTNAQRVVDDIFAALYYIELGVKDKKLALPLGRNIECTDTLCPQNIESRFAEHAFENIVANLESARDLMTGKEGVGFDDFLETLDAGAVGVDMINALDEAIALTQAQETSFESLLTSDIDAANEVHDAIKAYTDILKSDFVSVLNLRIPEEGAGDND